MTKDVIKERQNKRKRFVEYIDDKYKKEEQNKLNRDRKAEEAFLEGYKLGVQDGFESGFTMKVNVCEYCNKNIEKKKDGDKENIDPGVG